MNQGAPPPGPTGPYLLRTDPDGTRHVSWRVWVLVWLVPVAFLVAAAYLALEVLYTRSVTQLTTGTVVRVYEWDSTNPLDEGPKVYSPLYRYTWTDGTETEATAGMSSSLWNFPVGTEKQIRFHPDRKDDVILAGPGEWLIARIIGLIGACFLPVSLFAAMRLRRWRNSGKSSPQTAQRA